MTLRDGVLGTGSVLLRNGEDNGLYYENGVCEDQSGVGCAEEKRRRLSRSKDDHADRGYPGCTYL